MDARHRLRFVASAAIALSSLVGACAPRQILVDGAPSQRASAATPVVLAAPTEVDAKIDGSLEEHPTSRVEIDHIIVAPRVEAGPPRVIERNSRAVALLPFGVGQLQNGETGLGVAFALSEALAGGASIALAGMAQHYQALDPNARDAKGYSLDLAAVNHTIETVVLGNRIAFGAWAALTIAGVLQAQLAFVPERATTSEGLPSKRPLPVVVPIVALSQGAADFGVVGSF